MHYETLGRGRPVLLLHGWLGSWALYRQTLEFLSKDFKTYALDFLGFGESFDRQADFTVNNFVELVDQFMDRLGIVKAPLIGHSMGGTVSLGATIRYPEKIVKTAVIGSPIDGNSSIYCSNFPVIKASPASSGRLHLCCACFCAAMLISLPEMDAHWVQ